MKRKLALLLALILALGMPGAMMEPVEIQADDAEESAVQAAEGALYLEAGEPEFQLVDLEDEPVPEAQLPAEDAGESPDAVELWQVESAPEPEVLDPETVEKTDASADFTIDESGVLTGYTGAGGDVTIPAGVTAIGESAFAQCTKLTGVTIPAGVTAIGEKAFYKCSELRRVDIPAGVVSIGKSAFFECSFLTSLALPDTLESIGNGAFYCCTNLKELTIPQSVSFIDGFAFYNCALLEKLTVEASVAAIEQYTFAECKNLQSVVLAEGVTSIGDCAFSTCGKQMHILIPRSVVSISDSAFEDPYGTRNITIEGYEGSYAQQFAADKGISFQAILPPTPEPTATPTPTPTPEPTATPTPEPTNGDFVIDSDGVLTEYTGAGGDVTIPAGVTAIGDRAFDSCNALTHVTIPDGVTRIGAYAFCNCPLTHVDIPSSVREIGEGAFADCDALESLAFPRVEHIEAVVLNGCDNLTSVYIPEGVVSIGESAFGQCSNLTSVVIPEGVVSIGESAFACCDSLTSVDIPSSVREIGEGAFAFCYALESLVFPRVEHIEARVLDGCENLTFVYIPEGVVSIGESAFECSNLTSVVIPEGVVSIGKRAFAYCDSLTSVDIPKGVVSIGESAFYRCGNLASVVIPESVVSIGEAAFAYCDSLTSIDIPKGVVSIGADVFYHISDLVVCGYTGSCAERYASDNGIAFKAVDAQPTSQPTATPEPTSTPTPEPSSASEPTATPAPVAETVNVSLTGSANTTKTITVKPGDVLHVRTDGLTWYTMDVVGSGSASGVIHKPEEYVYNGKTYSDMHVELGDDLYFEIDGSADELLYTFQVHSYTTMPAAGGGNIYQITPGKAASHSLHIYVKDPSQTAAPTATPKPATTVTPKPTATATPKPTATPRPADVNVNLTGSAPTSQQISLKQGETFHIHTDGITWYMMGQPGKTADLIEPEKYVVNGAVKYGSYLALGNDLYFDTANLSGTLVCTFRVYDYTIEGTSDGKPIYRWVSSSEVIHDLTVTIVGPDPTPNPADYQISGGVLTKYVGSGGWVVIPDTVTAIGDSAFSSCKKVTRVDIPDSVTAIGDKAFIFCTGLTGFTIPGSVKTVGKDAFYGCTNLRKVEIGQGVNSLGESVFSGCSLLSEVKLPKTMNQIGGFTFKDCACLEQVTIPEGVTVLETSLFKRCAALASVTLPKSVTSIKPTAFDSCPSTLTLHTPCQTAVTTLARKTGYTVAPSAHTPQAIPAVAATCAKSGWTAGSRCSVCGAVIESPTAVTVPHKLVADPAVAATCTKTGLTAGSHCSVCKAVIKARTVVPAKGHTVVVDPAVAATTLKTGLTQGSHCSVCKAVLVAQKVVPKLPVPTAVALNKTGTQTLQIGKKLTLVAKLTPANAVTTLTWKSSKPKVAAVTSKGVVKAVAKGTATISVTTDNGIIAKVKIKVVAPEPKKVKITQGKKATLKVGGKLTLKTKFTPTNAESKLTWKSDNTKVATVSKKGQVKAKKAGKATITVTTANGKKAKITITVK